jgi:hypothetical protein
MSWASAHHHPLKVGACLVLSFLFISSGTQKTYNMENNSEVRRITDKLKEYITKLSLMLSNTWQTFSCCYNVEG